MRDYDFTRLGIGLSDEWCGLVFTRVYPDGKLPPLVLETAEEAESEEQQAAPLGYVFVIEPGRQNPLYKLPAGHKKGIENPLETATREYYEETGIKVPSNRFTYAGKWERDGKLGPYKDILFLANITKSESRSMNMRHPENDGECPNFFDDERFWKKIRAGSFMQKHLSMLVECGLILPTSSLAPYIRAS